VQPGGGKKKARDESNASSGIKEKTSNEPEKEGSEADNKKDEDPSPSGKGPDESGPEVSGPTQKEGEQKPSRPSHADIPDHPGTFSINQALKKGREKEPAQKEKKSEEEKPPAQEITGETREFSQTDLEEAWKSFAEQYHDKPRLYNMLLSRNPQKQEDESIFFSLQNQLQQEQLTRIYNALLINLKRYLKNDRITIRMQVLDDTHNDGNKLYTDEDKFRFMEKKNKELTKLKQNFDLDFN